MWRLAHRFNERFVLVERIRCGKGHRLDGSLKGPLDATRHD